MADDNATPRALRICATCEWFRYNQDSLSDPPAPLVITRVDEDDGFDIHNHSGENVLFAEGDCERFPPIGSRNRPSLGKEHLDPQPLVWGITRCGEWRLREGLELVMPDEPTDAPAQP